MIEKARKGNLDLIITKSISRFARNTVIVLKFARELKSLGVGNFFELQKINTLTSEDELMMTVLSAFAQAESESSSENFKMTYRRKFKHPLSGLLYCSKCGAVLRHRVDKGNRSYWACSTNLKKSKDLCSGIFIPEKIADTWNITEKSIITEGENEYGTKYYTYTSKAEYDRAKFSNTTRED